MDKDAAFSGAKRCLSWLKEKMSTENEALYGVYERFQIDKNERSRCVRPDCNGEIARAISLYSAVTGDGSFDLMRRNIEDWLLSVQISEDEKWDGSFPFYLVDGCRYDDSLSLNLYQNDNGKVLISLIDLYRESGDVRFLHAAKRLADFWVELQQTDGVFHNSAYCRLQEAHRGPCFVLWLALGLLLCYVELKEAQHKDASEKAFSYALGLLGGNGRIMTTYEVENGEPWRPPASETAISLYCFARAYHETGRREYLLAALSNADFIVSLQEPLSGGIVNCDFSCVNAAKQNDSDLCDLVYVQGYALLGLAQVSMIESKYFKAAKRLADFLISIQCSDESTLWDGAWRGSYSIERKGWHGAAEGNPDDEGGKYSIYTGWCCAPIIEGIMTVAGLMEKPA